MQTNRLQRLIKRSQNWKHLFCTKPPPPVDLSLPQSADSNETREEKMTSLVNELVLLILQLLNEEGFNQTARMLERESGLYFDMTFFEKMVINGNWEEAERYLSSFTKVEDNRYSTKIYFDMRKQNFLEALDSEDHYKALNILSKDLNIFSTVGDGELFNEMTQLLALEDIRQHKSLSNYGDTASARAIMMIELKREIEANTIFNGKLNFPTMQSNRLRRLINQSLNWQHFLCTYPHLNPVMKTLLEDHVCPLRRRVKYSLPQSKDSNAVEMASYNNELVFLILQLLNEEGFNQTARMLERESGLYFDMTFFENMVINGNWEEAERYLSSFTKVEDNRYSTKIYFYMRKQNFLEALDRKDHYKALNILSKDLNVFSTVGDGELFNEMTQLLKLEDIRQHESLANYEDTASARAIMMIELKSLIEANTIFHGKLNFPIMQSNRLRCLINQSLNWQHLFCTNRHPNPVMNTLLEDHVCPLPPVDHSLPQSADSNAVPSQASFDQTFAASTSLPTQFEFMNLSGSSFTDAATVLSNNLRMLVLNPSTSAVTGAAVDEVDDSLVDAKPDVSVEADGIGNSVIIRPSRYLPLPLPSYVNVKKISNLVYYTAGNAILALASNGLHLHWKWTKDDDLNRSGQATTKFTPKLWQPKNSLHLLINDVSDNNHETSVSCFALTKNDSYLISASGMTISLFNLITYKVMKNFLPPPPTATCIAFYSEDNNIIAIGMDDSTILIYNVPLAEVIAKLKGHSEGVTGLAFSTALNILVSSGADTQISLWNVDRWEKEKCRFLCMSDGKLPVVMSATYLQFHQDQTRFLVVHKTQLAIYEAKELKCLLQWTPVGSVSISQATFSCDSQMVYAGFVDGTIFVFDASKLELKCTVHCVIDACPNAIASHPQKPSQFAVGLTDGTVLVIEPQEPEGEWFVLPPDNISLLQPPTLPESSELTKPKLE